MSALIVYFSLEGNTKWAVERIAAELRADKLQLIPKEAYPDKGFGKFFRGGKSAVMKEAPKLQPYQVDLAKYDQIILATPVWAGTFAPPLRTFIMSEKLTGKRFGLVACSGGGSPAKAFAGMKELLGIKEDVPELGLVSPKEKPDAGNDAAIAEFCSRLSVED